TADRGPTSLADVLESVLGTVAALMMHEAAKATVQLSPTLPPVSTGRDLLRQVLLLCLGSLVEAAAGASIQLSATPDRCSVLLSLTARWDEGADPRDSPAPSEDRRLAVAQRLLALQGGQLELQWPPSSVSPVVVRVTLPSLRPVTVLIVDDDPDFVQLLERY